MKTKKRKRKRKRGKYEFFFHCLANIVVFDVQQKSRSYSKAGSSTFWTKTISKFTFFLSCVVIQLITICLSSLLFFYFVPENTVIHAAISNNSVNAVKYLCQLAVSSKKPELINQGTKKNSISPLYPPISFYENVSFLFFFLYCP